MAKLQSPLAYGPDESFNPVGSRYNEVVTDDAELHAQLLKLEEEK